jgi:hypothetical protein
MSEHRSAVTRIVGSSLPRRRRWVIGAVAALGASGLILGGVGVPVSADDVNAGGNPHASATVQDGCVTVAAGTGEADGSVQPQGDGAQLQVAGDGTATVSVCRDDLGDPPSGDPGDQVPGDLDDVVPGDLDDVVPGDPDGSLAGEVVAVVTGALEGDLPGDGDGSLPGDPDGLPGGLDGVDPGELGEVVPGGLGGLVPDGSGIDPDGLLDRLAQIIPGAIGGAEEPGGNGGDGPAVNTSATGSASGSVAVSGEDAERGAPTDVVLGTELGHGEPPSVGTAVSTGGALPRTGGGLGNGVLRLVALVGLGRAALGLANRRRRFHGRAAHWHGGAA